MPLIRINILPVTHDNSRWGQRHWLPVLADSSALHYDDQVNVQRQFRQEVITP
jgi:hypothetical protein